MSQALARDGLVQPSSRLKSSAFPTTLILFFCSDANGFVRVVEAEEEQALAVALEGEGVHVFEVDAGLFERRQDLGQTAGAVGHFDGQHVGDFDQQAVFLQEVFGRLPVAHDAGEGCRIAGPRQC